MTDGPGTSVQLASKRILVVDDDMDIRETLVQILEFEGFQVDCASNGQEALDHLSGPAERPKLILLDLMMPVMNGYEFRLAQRARPEVADIPVIILSADRNIEQKATAAHVQTFLKKPIELDTLLDAVHKHCGRHTA